MGIQTAFCVILTQPESHDSVARRKKGMVIRMNKSFPTRMVLLRKERGLSQKEVAARLGVSQALLSHYEKGIRECGLDFVVRSANFYHVTCDYLLGCSESRTGLTGFFTADETEQDQAMNISTIYRAAARLLEAVNLEWDTVLGDRMQWLFALSVYNGLAASAQAGFLPADAIRFEPQAAGILARGMMEAITRSIVDSGAESGVAAHEKGLPQCMRTLISESENYIRRNVDQYLAGAEMK